MRASSRPLANVLIPALLLIGLLPGIVRAQVGDPRQLATAMARITAMEDELRALRGRIETMEHEKLQQLRELEDRLTELERRPASGAPTSPGPVAAAPPGAVPSPTPPVRPTSPTPPSVVGAPGNPQHGQVLGTLPREAIMGAEGAAKPPAPRPPSAPVVLPAGAPAAFAAARDLLNKGDTGGAESAFKQFVELYPKDVQAPQAAYVLGDLYLARGGWQEAAATFSRNYQSYGPDAPRAPDNLLKLGVSLARGGETDKACLTFNELGKRHATASPAIRQALARERAAARCA